MNSQEVEVQLCPPHPTWNPGLYALESVPCSRTLSQLPRPSHTKVFWGVQGSPKWAGTRGWEHKVLGGLDSGLCPLNNPPPTPPRNAASWLKGSDLHSLEGQGSNQFPDRKAPLISRLVSQCWGGTKPVLLGASVSRTRREGRRREELRTKASRCGDSTPEPGGGGHRREGVFWGAPCDSE